MSGRVRTGKPTKTPTPYPSEEPTKEPTIPPTLFPAGVYPRTCVMVGRQGLVPSAIQILDAAVHGMRVPQGKERSIPTLPTTVAQRGAPPYPIPDRTGSGLLVERHAQ